MTNRRTGGLRSRLVPVLGLILLCSAAPALAVCPDCDGDGFDDQVDCDDTQATVYPGAPELCDNRDNDCDGFVDEDLVEACSTNCGTGTSTCRGGLYYNCTARPCCDQTIGPNQPITDLCPTASVGGQTICVLPGVYSASCSLNAALVSTGGPAVTTVTGDFVSNSLRIQGFTFTGHPSTPDFHSGDWIGNVLNAGLSASAGTRSQIVGNRVTGDLHANYAYSVRDNVVDGGILTIDTESDTARYIDAVGNVVRNGGIRANWTSIIEGNQVSGPAGIETTNGRAIRIVGNTVEGADVGISVLTHPNGSSTYLVARNRVMRPTIAGVRMRLGIPQNALRVYDNLITGSGTAADASAGVLLDVTNNISFFPTLFDVKANTISGHRTGVDLSCVFCSTLTAGLTSNVIAFNAAAGVFGAPLQPITASNNDVYGSVDNWLGIPDPTGSNKNISADPLFVDPPGGEFHLLPASPGLEAGVPHTVSLDLVGVPRALDGNLDGLPAPDLGALETDPEIGRLRYALGPMRLEWEPYPYASTGYDLYSGLISILKATGNYSQNPPVCHEPMTEYPVPDAVPLGDALFHHVAPHGTVPGSIGSDSQGHPRPLPAPCP